MSGRTGCVALGMLVVHLASGATASSRPDLALNRARPLAPVIAAGELEAGESVLFGPRGAVTPDTAIGFADQLEAVLAAVNRFNPRSIRDDREFLGAILVRAGSYFYSAAAGEAGRDRITARIRFPESFDIVAFWHTHGAHGEHRHLFSALDTHLANSQGRPFYLADHTGALKVFSPGDRILSAFQAGKLGLPPRIGFAAGRTVFHADGTAARVRTADEAETRIASHEPAAAPHQCPPS